MAKDSSALNIEEIMRLLPHRYPFLMLDKVLALEPGKSCKAVKNISINEPIFLGHFPDLPTFPGVLILEVMAQACGVLMAKSVKRAKGRISLYAGVDKARFKRRVSPGDQLLVEVALLTTKLDLWVFSARATVEGQLACSAEVRLVAPT